MKIPFQSDLSGFYAIRQISSVFNISLSSPWLISSHVYYSFTSPRACGVPCKAVDNDLWEQSVLHTNHGDQVHKFSQVWGRVSEIPHSKLEVGHLQGADYCTTISCASESSDLSCFFKPLSHSSCYEPHPHTSPTSLHEPLPGLDPGCLLSPRLMWTEFSVAPVSPLERILQSLVSVCLICPACIHWFIHFIHLFTHPSISQAFTRPTMC